MVLPLGHCLRRPAASLERAALAATDAQRYKQSKPAPWHNACSFLFTSCRQLDWISSGTVAVAELVNCAADREAWKAKADDIAGQYTLKPP